jgi:hypothetical protein
LRPAAAACALAAVLAGCGGESAIEPREVAGCLGDDGVATVRRGERDAATEVYAFRIPTEPATHGLLIFVDRSEQAEALARDIEAEAAEQGHVAHLLHERNAIAHFLTEDEPNLVLQARIGRCLE